MRQSLKTSSVNQENDILCITRAIRPASSTARSQLRSKLKSNSRFPCMAGIAAAIWYLLVPPLAGTNGVNSTAPLFVWNKAGTYSTEGDCSTAKSNFVATISAFTRAGQNQDQNMLTIELSRCISSDDYRLESAQDSGSQASPQQNPANGWQQAPSLHQ